MEGGTVGGSEALLGTESGCLHPMAGVSRSTTTWESVPNDIDASIVQRLGYPDRYRNKLLSKSSKQFMESDVLGTLLGGDGESVFTAIFYYIKNETWHSSAYDLHSKTWRALPTLSLLPIPDPELFKEYSVCGDDGLLCTEVSKLPRKGVLVVFNLWTGGSRALPPLLHPRIPVLVHAIHYYIKNETWRSCGYDLHSKSWRALPKSSCLPLPDAELFKEYSVCGNGGLMCAEVSKLTRKGDLVVLNPLTGESRALPPLLHPRIPVLVHIVVDSAKSSYKVVVAGSSSASDGHLSRKVEVFDSSTSKWKEARDLPGPAFGLNEHQAGVSLNGKLFFISFLECGGRGVVAFGLEEEKWLPDLTTPIPWSSSSNILQLVENDGKLFLFSEQGPDCAVDHSIDELELPNPESGVLACRWRHVVRVKSTAGRSLQVYPEHTCVGFGVAKLCVFNTLNRDGVVYDIREDQEPCIDGPEFRNSKAGANAGRRRTVVMRKNSGVLLSLSACAAAFLPTAAGADVSLIRTLSATSDAPGGLLTACLLPAVGVTILMGFGTCLVWKCFRYLRDPARRWDINRALAETPEPRRDNFVFELPEELREA